MPTAEKDPHRYDDMLHMPHHVSEDRLPMPLLKRAAQFSPFAALAGYEERIAEAARETEQRAELTESVKEELNARLQQLQACLRDRSAPPEVTVTYFRPDPRKEGGAYVTVTNTVRTIDTICRRLVFTDRSFIPIEDITALQGDMLHGPDDFFE